MMLSNVEPFRVFDDESENSNMYALRVLKHVDYPLISLSPETEYGKLCYIGYLIFRTVFSDFTYEYLTVWLELEQRDLINNFDPTDDYVLFETTSEDQDVLEDDCYDKESMRIILKRFLWQVQLILNRELKDIDYIVSCTYKDLTFVTNSRETKTIPIFDLNYIVSHMTMDKFKTEALNDFIVNQCYHIHMVTFDQLMFPEFLQFDSQFMSSIYEFDSSTLTYSLRQDEELNDILIDEFIIKTVLYPRSVQPLREYNLIYDLSEAFEEERLRFFIPLLKRKIANREPPFDKHYTVHNFIKHIKACDYTTFPEFKNVKLLKALVQLETSNKRTNAITYQNPDVIISTPKLTRLLNSIDPAWKNPQHYSIHCILDWFDIIGIKFDPTNKKPVFHISASDWNKLKTFMLN